MRRTSAAGSRRTTLTTNCAVVLRSLGIAAALIAAAIVSSRAQQADSSSASKHSDWNQLDTRWLSVRLGQAIVVDASAFDQNANSETQVGDIANVGRVRFARTILSGAINLTRPLVYLISVDASGLYADHSPVFTVTDLALTIPIGGHGHLAIGRQKEGVTEQMMSPSRGIPFAERAAPVTVFVPTRNDGVRLWGSIPRVTGGWTVGVFNNALFDKLSPRANGYQVAGRIFYAPYVSADFNRAVQLAIDARWRQASNGTLDYKTKPENNEAPDFIKTDSFDASSGITGDAELLVVHHAISFTAEALPTQALGTSTGAQNFFAYYGALSWRPLGDSRPYEDSTGTLGRVRQDRRFVWEISARFSHTDLSSRTIDGGVLDIPSLAIGLFGPSSTRVLLDGGLGRLRRNGVSGRTGLLTFRLQWELR